MADLLDDARKLRLLDWLTAPPEMREPDSLNKLATELDVTAKTLRNWRADDTFRAVWEKQAKQIVGDPEKVQRAIEHLYEMGCDVENSTAARVKSLDTYLKAVDAIKPPAIDAAVKRAAELSDDELTAMLAEAAQKELQARSGGA